MVRSKFTHSFKYEWPQYRQYFHIKNTSFFHTMSGNCFGCGEKYYDVSFTNLKIIHKIDDYLLPYKTRNVTSSQLQCFTLYPFLLPLYILSKFVPENG